LFRSQLTMLGHMRETFATGKKLVNPWPRRAGFSTVLAEWIVLEQARGKTVAYFDLGTRATANMQQLVLARGGDLFTATGNALIAFHNRPNTRALAQLKAATDVVVAVTLERDDEWMAANGCAETDIVTSTVVRVTA
jgi:hypothetical protein